MKRLLFLLVCTATSLFAESEGDKVKNTTYSYVDSEFSFVVSEGDGVKRGVREMTFTGALAQTFLDIGVKNEPVFLKPDGSYILKYESETGVFECSYKSVVCEYKATKRIGKEFGVVRFLDYFAESFADFALEPWQIEDEIDSWIAKDRSILAFSEEDLVEVFFKAGVCTGGSTVNGSKGGAFGRVKYCYIDTSLL